MTSVLARHHSDFGVVELSELVPLDLTEVLEGIDRVEHSPLVRAFIDGYEAVAHRDAFLWKWVHHGLELTSLPTVAPEWADHVRDTKLLGVMFDVMLDDVADRRVDGQLLEQLLRVPFESQLVDECAVPATDRPYLRHTVRLWERISQRARALPKYKELADLLEYDYRQLLNCMRYALITARDPRRINLTEHDLYQPHNMHMVISGTLDVMASPGFDMAEIGQLREILWQAQMMGRIGNMVTTWQRELEEHDLTSGVFAMALRMRAVTPSELLTSPPERIEERILGCGIQEAILDRWSMHRDRLLSVAAGLRSFDVRELVEGLNRLLQIHLASRGLK